jgi:hypothetical protein
LRSLPAISIGGSIGVLLTFLGARLWLGMYRGHAVFHATGVGFVFLHGLLTFIVITVLVLGYVLYLWIETADLYELVRLFRPR